MQTDTIERNVFPLSSLQNWLSGDIWVLCCLKNMVAVAWT